MTRNYVTWLLLVATIALGVNTVRLSRHEDERQAEPVVAGTQVQETKVVVPTSESVAVIEPRVVKESKSVSSQSSCVSSSSSASVVSVTASSASSSSANRVVFTEGDAAMQGIMKIASKEQYRDLFRVLKLSRDQRNEFAEIMSARSLKLNEAMQVQETPDGKRDAAAKVGYEFDNQLMSLLGSDGFAKYKDYQQSIREHQSLTSMRSALFAADVDLPSESQERQLLQVFKDELAAFPQPGRSQSTAATDSARLYADWQIAMDGRVVDRIKGILSSDQVDAYREYREAQSKMMSVVTSRAGGR